LFFSSFCLAAAAGMATAVGTTEVRAYKLNTSRCAADPGSARIGGVSFCGHKEQKTT
jgi:hypothetical protein